MRIGQFAVLRDGTKVKLLCKFFDVDTCKKIVLIREIDTDEQYWLYEDAFNEFVEELL